MTPKEKAKQLFDKFYYVKDEQGFHSVNKYRAKQCALIAVDEILKNDGFTQFDDYLTEYWKEVKKEIEKL